MDGNLNVNDYRRQIYDSAMYINPFEGNDLKAGFKTHGFINNNDLLHNNLHSILLYETVQEYSVFIDSKDRNYQVYPDPFRYKVTFHPLNKTIEYQNGIKIVNEIPNPVINDNFVNVRYIKLEQAVLPFYHKIKLKKEKDCNGEIVKSYVVDTTQPLTDNLYTVLSVGRYSESNYKSTNDVLSDNFAIIYYNTKINDTHFLGKNNNGIKIFPADNLGVIDYLDISFMNPYGKLLKCEHVKKEIHSNMICECDEEYEDPHCFKHNLFHPLNPIFQNHLHFKIGVLEPRLSKKLLS
jgi:hypothetical protein